MLFNKKTAKRRRLVLHNLRFLNGGTAAHCEKCGFLGVTDKPENPSFFERMESRYPHRFPYLHIHNLMFSDDGRGALCCCGFRCLISEPKLKEYFKVVHRENIPRELKAKGLI